MRNRISGFGSRTDQSEPHQVATQPKYRRIAAELRDAIDAGDYVAGDRLPGENDLMARYGIARMTARQALGVLLQEGIAVARKGAGVFVRDFTPVVRQAVRRLAQERWGQGSSIWSADIDGRDLDVTTQVSETPAPDPIAQLLEVEPAETVCVRERRFVLDGKPVMLSTSFLPASIVRDSAITQEDTGPGGTYARLAELGHAPAHFREDVRARMPKPKESDAFELPSGTPVIEIVRTAYTAEGRPVEINQMTLDASAYVLRYDIDA
jgi:GntR family transcriptional regulator